MLHRQLKVSVTSYHPRRYISYLKDSYGIYVNGEFVFPKNTGYFDVISPQSQSYLTKVASATSQDVDNAAEIAQNAYQSGIWSKSDVRHRAKVLNNIADVLRKEIPRLADLEVAQTGRPIREMKAQLARLPEWFEYFGSLIRTHEGTSPPFFGPYLNYVKRVPLGVVAQLTPWNHPMASFPFTLSPHYVRSLIAHCGEKDCSSFGYWQFNHFEAFGISADQRARVGSIDHRSWSTKRSSQHSSWLRT